MTPLKLWGIMAYLVTDLVVVSVFKKHAAAHATSRPAVGGKQSLPAIHPIKRATAVDDHESVVHVVHGNPV